MIVIWVVELYLTKLEEIRLEGLEKSDRYDSVQKEFETFISFPEVSMGIIINLRHLLEVFVIVSSSSTSSY